MDPCQFFDFCHQTSCEKLPYPFPEEFFTRCLVTKSKNLQDPKWIDFLLLCPLKKHIFLPQRVPPDEWCSTRCKILPLQLASSSFTFTKMQASKRRRISSYHCAGRYIDYGHDKALHQRKGGSPSQLVLRKARLWDEERTQLRKWIGKLFIRCLVTKIKKIAGSKNLQF